MKSSMITHLSNNCTIVEKIIVIGPLLSWSPNNPNTARNMTATVSTSRARVNWAQSRTWLS